MDEYNSRAFSIGTHLEGDVWLAWVWGQADEYRATGRTEEEAVGRLFLLLPEQKAEAT